jgi:hypothetical protein
VAEHLKAVGCPPLQLALPWIMTAFAGHLAVGEVLLLWDRVIGFDSLLPLPLLAVAVIAFRRQVRGQTLRLATRSLQPVKMYARQQTLVASCWHSTQHAHFGLILTIARNRKCWVKQSHQNHMYACVKGCRVAGV